MQISFSPFDSVLSLISPCVKSIPSPCAISVPSPCVMSFPSLFVMLVPSHCFMSSVILCYVSPVTLCFVSPVTLCNVSPVTLCYVIGHLWCCPSATNYRLSYWLFFSLSLLAWSYPVIQSPHHFYSSVPSIVCSAATIFLSQRDGKGQRKQTGSSGSSVICLSRDLWSR